MHSEYTHLRPSTGPELTLICHVSLHTHVVVDFCFTDIIYEEVWSKEKQGIWSKTKFILC